MSDLPFTRGGVQEGGPKAGEELLPLVYEELLALDEALDRFALADQQKADLVKLRYFAGLSFDEAAEILGVSVPTAKRWWAYARAWLFHEMTEGKGR